MRQMTFGDLNIAYSFDEMIWNTRGYETDPPDMDYPVITTTWKKKWYDPGQQNETLLEIDIVTNCYYYNEGDPYYTWEWGREVYYNGELIYSNEDSGNGWKSGLSYTGGKSCYYRGLHRCESEMSDNLYYYEEFKNTPADRFYIREPGIENNTEEEEFCPDMPEENTLVFSFEIVGRPGMGTGDKGQSRPGGQNLYRAGNQRPGNRR